MQMSASSASNLMSGRRYCRAVRHINVNLLRYFSGAAMLDVGAKAPLRLAFNRAMEWAVDGRVIATLGLMVAASPTGIILAP